MGVTTSRHASLNVFYKVSFLNFHLKSVFFFFFFFLSWGADIYSYKLFAAAAANSLQLCPTLCDPTDSSPPGSPVPGILQARTRVGCHFLLQCMKVKSESEVAQSCLTLSDTMDCSLPGSSVHGILQARLLEWGAIAFSDKLFRHLWFKDTFQRCAYTAEYMCASYFLFLLIFWKDCP